MFHKIPTTSGKRKQDYAPNKLFSARRDFRLRACVAYVIPSSVYIIILGYSNVSVLETVIQSVSWKRPIQLQNRSLIENSSSGAQLTFAGVTKVFSVKLI